MTGSTGWRRLLRLPRGDIRAGVEDELAAHIEMLAADFVAQGMAAADARARAEREFGALSGIRDECIAIERRRRRRLTFSESLMDLGQDVRYALRSLRSNAAFAGAAILCTALGVGATATIFSAVYATLIRPLPFERPDELVAVYGAVPKRQVSGSNISFADYESWRTQNRSFVDIGIWSSSSPSFTREGVGDAERVDGARVSPNLFKLLGARPMLGRTFLDEESEQGSDRVVILGYNLWQRRFNGDPDIVGKPVTVNLREFTVVGVMPRGFAFPERGQAWLPFVPDRQESRSNRIYAGAIGRLKGGTPVDVAQRDLDTVMERLEVDFPQSNEGWRAQVVTMRDDLVGDLKRPVQVFSAAAALVLLIACANVANLLLTRGTARRREIAVRTALGAGRGRLVRQLITESLVLSVLGGLLGAVITTYGVRLLRLGFPDEVPYYIEIGVNVPTLVFAAVVSVVSGLAFGLLPAFRSTSGSLDRALREGGRSGSDGPARARVRNAIVVGELALSVTLMIGAGLLVKSYRAISSTKLGFDESGVVSFRVALPPTKYDQRPKRLAYFEELERRLEALPQVASVGLGQGAPFSGWNIQAAIMADGWPPAKPGGEFVSHYQFVSPTFLPTMGVPLLRGRALTDADRDSANPVAVVNATFAKRAFPGGDALGKRIRVGGPDEQVPWVTIVGVVADYRHYQLPRPMGPAVYFTQASAAPSMQTVVIKVRSGDPNAILPAARDVLRRLDPDVPPFRIVTFEKAMAVSLWRQRFQGFVVAVFAVLALVLAAVGIYGVISYGVAQRTREFGVRVALGAQMRDIIGLVLGQGVLLAVSGIVLGLLGGALLTRFLDTLLYEVQPRDPVVFGGVALGLGAIALLAVAIPAWRATTVDPLVAMRPD